MKYNPEIHHRQSIRLKGYDYSQPGAYFITICTQVRDNVLGEIIDGKMVLNEWGRIVKNEWLKAPIVRKNIELDEFIIMPDHIHGIIVITNRPTCPPDCHQGVTHQVAHTLTAGTVGAIIGQFKSITIKQINQLQNSSGISIWQRNYYEEIIRNENQLNETRKYIINNPIEWENNKTVRAIR